MGRIGTWTIKKTTKTKENLAGVRGAGNNCGDVFLKKVRKLSNQPPDFFILYSNPNALRMASTISSFSQVKVSTSICLRSPLALKNSSVLRSGLRPMWP